MNSLFAPWRMEFIEKNDPSKDGCVLCKLYADDELRSKQVLEVGETCYVVMNKFPYSNGHVMIVPKRHEKDWTKLTEEEGLELQKLTQKALRALALALQPQGYNLGVNLGRPAGAGIEDHVHQHIVPRWVGDFNFMPLFSETKVISEHLDTTFKKLKDAWGKL